MILILFNLYSHSYSIHLLQDIQIDDFMPDMELGQNLELPAVVVPELQVPPNAEIRLQVENMLPGHSLRIEEARELYLNIRQYVAENGFD